MISAARLRELLNYEPETGLFFWLVNRGSAKAGAAAGCRKSSGYMEIHVEKKTYLAHRLAILWSTGVMPAHEVDHIDGHRDNNALANLRDVQATVNHQNQRRAHKSNRTGLLGASWHKGKQKFRAGIDVEGRKVHLGYFKDAAAAHAAYLNAKRAMHAGCTI